MYRTDATIAEQVTWYTAQGIRVIPLSGKKPWDYVNNREMNGWPTFTVDPGRVAEYFPTGCNLGVVTGATTNGKILVDLDMDDDVTARVASFFVEGNFSWGYRHQTRHILCIAEEGEECHVNLYPPGSRASDGDRKPLVNIRAHRGGQTMVPPSVHPVHGVIEVGAVRSIARVPTVAKVAQIAKLIATLGAVAGQCAPGNRHNVAVYLSGFLCKMGMTAIEKVQACVMAVMQVSGVPNGDRNALEAIRDTVRDFNAGRDVAGISRLKELWPADRQKSVERELKQWMTTEERSAEQLRVLDLLTDYGMGDEVFTRHPDWTWVAGINKWEYYDGGCWHSDDRNTIEANVREIQDESLVLINPRNKGDYSRMRSVRFRHAALDGARAGRTRHISEFDRVKDHIVTPRGVLDLTGAVPAIKPHSKELYARHMLPCHPEGECPVFLSRLEQWQPDPEMRDFIHCMAGYFLLSNVGLEKIFFLTGEGANGKTALINTFQRCIGNGWRKAPRGFFTQAKFQKHSTDEAMMIGARIIYSNELGADESWDIEKLKDYASPGEVSARFVGRDNLTFPVTWKLLFSANEIPMITRVNWAIQRRFLVIPFEQQFEETEIRVEDEPEYMAETPGILNWMLRGVGQYKLNGLRPPARVLEHTRRYIEENNIHRRFVEETCERVRGQKIRSTQLFETWKLYCERNGNPVGHRQAFTSALRSLGIRSESDGRLYYYIDIRYRED